MTGGMPVWYAVACTPSSVIDRLVIGDVVDVERSRLAVLEPSSQGADAGLAPHSPGQILGLGQQRDHDVPRGHDWRRPPGPGPSARAPAAS